MENQTSTRPKFFALTDDNTLVSFSPDNLAQISSTPITGLDGILLGIDVRPANDLIYGLTTANKIYTVDPNSGAATFVSSLNMPFAGGTISGFDFNPVPDRLRLVGDNDQNFRINVDTGEVLNDGTVAFVKDKGDVNETVNPNLTSAAYLNSFSGATATKLFGIDTLLNDLVLQDPANDGTLMTIGDLGINFDTLGGLDILTSATGMNMAFAITNSTLYSIDLATGMATSLGMIGSDPSQNFQGLTILSDLVNDNEVVGTDGNDSLAGGAGNDTVAGGLGDDSITGGTGNDLLRGDRNTRDAQIGEPGGNDTIMGGAGEDRIGGKAGNDMLFGGDGNDRIWGDEGDDLIRGGLGNDQLWGGTGMDGAGSDTFVLALGEGTDRIMDFEVGIDFIGLTGGLTFADLTLTASANGTLIQSGSERLAVIMGVEATALTPDAFVLS
ncbi:MAG: DUF4394 domain-containing protein [Oscillatoriales cyanobacterium RM2_1_1]|nr:DUF4394 domain-containing protein [Oscillatoriales cyanobacterium SM2_3_0]NJO47915.1 DUF4394 domain-containing protein [Oscillatoriales cyanobacterium RM2_1_1]